MPFEMKFQVDHLKRALSAARHATFTPKKLLGSVGESLLRVNRDRHNAGLAPDGSMWKPLSPLTIGSAIWNAQGESFRKKGTMSLATARKVQERRNRTGVLHATGHMLKSFNYQVHGDTLTLGFDGATESMRAAWHHSGTQPYTISAKRAKALRFGGIYRKRVNHPGLPSRKLVGFPASDRRLASEVVGDYLMEILKRVR